jgi:hypothetical protein
MKFMAFVGTAGPMPSEDVEEMNRGWPAYEEVLAARSGLRLGRELRVQDEGVRTVQVRAGAPLITDGPFAETKEYVAGLDVFEASGWEDAIELESLSPVARFLPFEIRVLPGGFRLGPWVAAFAERDDSAGIPHMLILWVDGDSSHRQDDHELKSESETWRERLEASGVFVLGGAIGDPRDAKTLRISDGSLSDGPFINTSAFIAGIEVVRAASLPAAAELAATHPLARVHTIEVRPFYS